MRKLAAILISLISFITANAVIFPSWYKVLGEVTHDNIRYRIVVENENDTTARIAGFTVDEAMMPEIVEFESKVMFEEKPYWVKTVDREAFRGCKNRHRFILPDSVKRFETYAFSDCADVYVKINKGSTLRDSVFYNTTISDPYMLHEVETLGNEALMNCNADELVFGKGLYVLSSRTFVDAHIKKLTFNCEGIPFIGQIYTGRQTFSHSYVEEVRVGRNIPIPVEMFYDCPNLKRIIFSFANKTTLFSDNITGYAGPPDYTVAPIEQFTWCVIGKCPNLKEVVVLDKNPAQLLVRNVPGGNVFMDDYSHTVLKVPAGSEELYRSHEIWGQFEEIEGFQPGEYTGLNDVEISSPEGCSSQKIMAGNTGIDIAVPEPCTIELYNSAGILIHREKHSGGRWHADVPKGFYLLRYSE